MAEPAGEELVVVPRIAHVTTVHRMGDNRILRKECTALAEAGFAVSLVVVADEDGRAGPVDIVALPRQSSRVARALRGQLDAWRALRRIDPALLHVHDPELVPLAVAWRVLRRRPAVYDAHEDLEKQVAQKTYIPRGARWLAARLARAIEVLADRGLSGVIAATPSIADRYRVAPVTLVQNFPWLRDYPAPAAVDPSTSTIVYVGSVTEDRGLMEMLGAVAGSRGRRRLVIAGPLSPPALGAAIDRHAEDVKYLGTVDGADVPELLAASRVGLALLHPRPNYLEAQSTKIFEYMAAGRPFVASNFGAWTRMFGDLDCGLFVDPLDVPAIRDAIDELLADPARAEAMGQRGRRAMEQRFAFEVEAVRLVGAVRGLLAQGGSGRRIRPDEGPRVDIQDPAR